MPETHGGAALTSVLLDPLPQGVRPVLPALTLPFLAAVHTLTAFLYVSNTAPGTSAAFSGLPLDDAWIHLVYARGLVQDGLLTYNPGEPATGATSPLWAVCLAPLVWVEGLLGGGLTLWVKGLGLLLGIGTSQTLAQVLLRVSGKAWLGVLGGTLLALDPSFCFAKVSGMEVPLAALCSLCMVRALLDARPGLLGLTLALAPLARPELAVLSVVVGLLAWRRTSSQRVRLWLAAPSGVGAGLWLGYCWWATGRLLPATFYVKHSADGGGIHLEELQLLFGPMLLSQIPFALGSGVALSLFGAYWLRVGKGRDHVAPDLGWLLVGWLPLWGLALAWAHPFGEWWPFYWVRYVLPGYPLALVPLLLGALASQEARASGVRWLGRALVVLPLCALPLRLPASAEQYAWNCQNIREVQEATAAWLAQRIQPGESVAVQDAGAVRFGLPREARVIDLVGLNSLAVLEEGAEALLLRERPRFVVFFPGILPHWLNLPGYQVGAKLESPFYTLMTAPQAEVVILERLARRE